MTNEDKSNHPRQLERLVKSAEQLAKVPRHLAISVVPENKETVLSVLFKRLWSGVTGRWGYTNDNPSRAPDHFSLQSIAKLVAWASAANIPVISLYDYNGVIKARYKELGSYIQEEILQDFWTVKQARGTNCEPPVVKFHNVHKSTGYTNGVNGTKSHDAVHIFVYSRNDGKPAIVQAVKDIYLEKVKVSGNRSSGSTENENEHRVNDPLTNHSRHKPVDEKTLDLYLNRYNSWPAGTIVDAKTDPDLLLVLGNVKSTLGFLPWHIRLTEIHWLPTPNRLELSDFCATLAKFSKCQQRYGT